MGAIIRELIGPEWSRFRQLNVRFHGRSLEEAVGVEGGDAADGAGHDKRTPHDFLSACQGVLVSGRSCAYRFVSCRSFAHDAFPFQENLDPFHSGGF